MAFREPASLLVDIPPGPFPKIRDLPETVGSLARMWDERGLLFLHKETGDGRRQVRIFNAYKSAACDRQIGDKRGRNSVEAQVAGPSSSLPAGVDLQDISINPYLQCIFVSITDRKDYYHQLQVTESKGLFYSVGPPVPIAEVVKTRAYTSFLERSRQKYKSEKQGDRFSLAEDRKHVVPCHLPADSIWVSSTRCCREITQE